MRYRRSDLARVVVVLVLHDDPRGATKAALGRVGRLEQRHRLDAAEQYRSEFARRALRPDRRG